ncbi:MAG: DUF1778 domain-containing protein [Candidatus Acidiferrales bacterium]
MLAVKSVIEEADRWQLSERDRLGVLKLLESPAAPNAKLRADCSGIAETVIIVAA